MQSIRLATRAAPRASRALATAAQHPLPASAQHAPAASPSGKPVSLSNIEAQWERLSVEEQAQVHAQLEEVQKKDWKSLSIDEKKAAYYVAFGPHGPRTPVSPPGTTAKTLIGITAALAATGVIFWSFRASAPPPPKTLTREWEEAANERAKEMKINPFHEDYKGKGFVTRA